MGNKHKGSNNERELLKMFSGYGWRAARVAGSGVNEESPCDLIAGKKGKKLAIECKSTRKNIQYISKSQMSDFIVFSEIMGLKPVIAIKFLREGWIFLAPSKLRDTGNNWAISLEDAKSKGKRIGQLISS
ncbi:MAG TPA: Holliday junction resolvase Hjc [Candidatus Nanoarchaeia archaeon]|nr:Holliday junction resolvase Hjc [Candidatus Nanoarchaeia archaeon]